MVQVFTSVNEAHESGLMESIYDGIQRPLKAIRAMSNSIYIPRGIATDALDREKAWEFAPQGNLKVGDHITGGDIFGVHSKTH